MPTAALGVAREVNVIGHEHVGVDCAPTPQRRFGEPADVRVKIVLMEENRLTIVAALDDVCRYVCQEKSGLAGHGAEIRSRHC